MDGEWAERAVREVIDGTAEWGAYAARIRHGFEVVTLEVRKDTQLKVDLPE